MIGSLDENGERISEHQLSGGYNLPRRTIRSWKDRADKGLCLHEFAGKLSSLDGYAQKNIKNDLKRRRIEKKPPDEEEMNQIIHDGVEATTNRKNRLIDDPCAATMGKYKGELKISRNTPQVVSQTRYTACSNVRMLWTMWVLLKILTKSITFPQFLLNWDAARFVIGVSIRSEGLYHKG